MNQTSLIPSLGTKHGVSWMYVLYKRGIWSLSLRFLCVYSIVQSYLLTKSNKGNEYADLKKEKSVIKKIIKK